MKIALLLFLTCLSTALAAPSPCPTCPKGLAVSYIEEILLPKAQEKAKQELPPLKVKDVKSQETPQQKKETVYTVSTPYRAPEKSTQTNPIVPGSYPHAPKKTK